jgi:hypothetical protein
MKEFPMDLYKFHILLGLLPKHISDSLMMWLFNEYLIPKLEETLYPTVFQQKFAILLNFDKQVLDLYDTFLQIYIEAAQALRIQEANANIQEQLVAVCVTLSTFLNMMGSLTGKDGISRDGVSDPTISVNLTTILGYEYDYDVVNLLLKKLYLVCETNQIELEPYIQEAHRIRYNG